ncbi:MAG: T9SS type A sorting domain-containing protein [bacterium]|nr:T9SS type A sorting domain-containing protein [bacterium]
MRYLLITLLMAAALRASAGPPDWTAPEPGGYDYSASINAALFIDEALTANANDLIAFFSNGELRGVSTPVSIGDQVFHLSTVFSNTATGEELQVRVYHAATDAVYIAQQPYTFVHQGVSGSFDAPYEIEVFTDGDAPIGLQALPAQQTLQGVPFAPLGLQPFLEQQDDDGIAWSADFNPHVLTFFNGAELTLIPTDPAWFGSTTVTVRATEQTPNAYFATAALSVTIAEAYAGPQWEDIPIQSAAPQAGFELLGLPGFEEAYGGPCLDYSLTPVLAAAGSQPQPPAGWGVPLLAQPFTMNISARAQYTQWLPLGDEADRLAFFINGQLSGTAAPELVNGQAYYFATVHHGMPEGEMEVRYFSAAHEALFTLPVRLDFGGNGQLGSPDEPLVLDFSPFLFELDEAGQLGIAPQDTAFRGAHPYTFLAADCDYPEALQDTVSTQLCYDIDSDEDGLCNTLDPAPFDPCFPDYEAPPLHVLDSNGDTLTSKGVLEVGTDPGDCHYSVIWRAFSIEDCSGVTVEAVLENQNGPSAGQLETVLLDAATGQYALYLTVPQGTYELEVVATDDYGNAEGFTYTFIVEDEEAPQLSCLDVEVALSYDGTGELLADEVLDFANSSDNCGLDYSTLMISQTAFDCSGLGIQSVELTASDLHGNSGSCTAQVEVFIDESIPPPWGTADIGMVPGSSAYAYDPCATDNPSKGHFTLDTPAYNPASGGGDQLAAVVQELCEGSGISIRVQELSAGTYAGIFMRNSSAAGSPMAGLFTNLTPVLRWESRLQPNGGKSFIPFQAAAAPQTIGLRRNNGLLQAYYRIPGGGGWQLVTQMQDHLNECVEVGFGAFTTDPAGTGTAVIGPVNTIGSSNTGFGGEPVVQLSEGGGSRPGIWPNPASGHITLSLGAVPEAPVQALLTDGLGREARAWVLPGGAAQHQLNVEGLPGGIYWLKIEGQPDVERLIISR